MGETGRIGHDGGRPWTMAELRRASKLWAERATLDAISEALGRTRQSVMQQVSRRRDLFPRRMAARSEIRSDGDPISLKLSVTPFLHRTIKAEAARRGISQNMLIREALRNQLLRKVGPAKEDAAR